MTESYLFSRQGESLVPGPRTRGFWNADSIDGRAIVGLIGHEIERRHGGDELLPARLTVDMHRLARQQPLEIVTRVVRDGGRLRLIEAALLSSGTEYARATCQLLRPTAPPPGRVWPGSEPWVVPMPQDLPTALDADERQLAEWRVIAGTMGAYGPRRVWIRPDLEIVAGEALTPFTRAASIADFASPWTHASDQGVGYINADVTMQLHRLPGGDWVGLDAMVHDASQGIAVGQCRIYDEQGPIGFASATAVANSRS